MSQTPAETRSPHFTRDLTARTYRDVHLPRVFAPWARVLLEMVPPWPGDAVLDVATGPGTVARQAALLAGPTGRVVGVDISGAMLSVARSFPTESGAAPIKYIEASATSLPVPDADFNIAYCQQGLQHMSDPLAALREMRRAVRIGGRFGIALWRQSPFSLFRDIMAGMGVIAEGLQPSEFGKDARELTAALRELGLEDVQVETREMVSVLEGGTAQAFEVAVATSAGAGIESLAPAQQQALREALSKALEPRLQNGAVHLISVSNIVSARVR